MPMKTSVILSVFNKTAYLRNCLLSLMSQSITPDEVVIGDDGSSEDIAAGIKDLTDRAAFPVKHVKQADKGFRLAASRNNAVKNASGDYLVFLDQDLIFTKHYLENLVQHAEPRRFYTGFPIWLSESQTAFVTPGMIESCDFESLTTDQQRRFIRMQYRKERLYTFLHALHLRRIGPSLRGGVFGVFKKDFINVNGFDETFQSWGYEDDDLGHRLYASGVSGINRIYKDYSMHCHHPQVQKPDSGRSLNRDYFKKRIKEIDGRNFRCRYGYSSPIEDNPATVREL